MAIPTLSVESAREEQPSTSGAGVRSATAAVPSSEGEKSAPWVVTVKGRKGMEVIDSHFHLDRLTAVVRQADWNKSSPDIDRKLFNNASYSTVMDEVWSQTSYQPIRPICR